MEITAEMDGSQRRACMRQQIHHMEQVNAKRRDYAPRSEVENNSELKAAEVADLPPLPERLPRPQYAVEAGLVGQNDDAELDFYVSCEQGVMDEVVAFVRMQQPTQAMKQYGLEQASFGNQPAVARYLVVENGTVLHSNVFERSLPERMEGIFVVEACWNPNQGWTNPSEDGPRFPLCFPGCIRNRTLVEFLLAHGADPNLGHRVEDRGRRNRLNRRSGQAFSIAVKTWDTTLLDLLISHGAAHENACPLQDVVVSIRLISGGLDKSRLPPFPDRRAMAEYLLALDGVDINKVQRREVSHALDSPRLFEDTTALTHACVADDWEYVEWLLEHGADPMMLQGKALQPQWLFAPYSGPNDPKIVEELIEKVKKWQESAESAAAPRDEATSSTTGN